MRLRIGHEEQAPERARFFEAEVNSRIVTLGKMQQEFFDIAIENGYPEEVIQKLTADALTEGILPRVFQQISSPADNLRVFYFVTAFPGKSIPAEAVHLTFARDYSGKLRNTHFRLIGPEMNTWGVPGVLPGHDDQYWVESWAMPMFKTSPMDERDALDLSKLDAHIPAFSTHVPAITLV